MKTKNLLKLAALGLGLLAGGNLSAQVNIITDNYNTVSNGTGFVLGSGVNSGINPPTTRLTGTAASGLRYYQSLTTSPKAVTAYMITNNSALKVAPVANSGRVTLSTDGSTPYDFGPLLGVASASPTNPAVYDVTISMANDSAGTQRFSFGLATVENNVTFWDFGLQLYRASTLYTVQRRIDSGSLNGSADLDSVITNGLPGNGALVNFLVRVTDAGAETTTFNSRVQVSLDGGTNWFYDTADIAATNNVGVTNQFRFDGASRYFIWDMAGNAAATYDNFSITLLSGGGGTPAATRTWTGAGTDDNWSTGANWGGTAPASGDPLVFAGANRVVNFNDLAGLVTPSLIFSNSDFVLGGAPLAVSGGITNLTGTNTFAGDLVWTSSTAKAWSLASGSELVLNNTNTVEFIGDHALNGGGTLHLKGKMNIGQATTANPAFVINEGKLLVDGGAFLSRGGFRIGSFATGAGAQVTLTNGASFGLTIPAGNLRVGDSANPVTARLNIHDSSLSLAGGQLGIAYAAGATSIVTQVGGSVSVGTVVFSVNGAGRGTYTIKDGSLETIVIREATSAGNSAMTFDNAVLRPASGASNDFFAGLNSASLLAGGLLVDATTDLTIGQTLSGTGGLVKSNAFTVTLTAANTYTGSTLVQQGKLALSTVQSNATAVTVADAAELGVNVRTQNRTLNVSSLNFAGASFGKLSFDLGVFNSPTVPLVKAGSLSVSGPVTIDIANGLQLGVGQIVLVDYDGTIGGGYQFTLGSLPVGVTAELVDNVANSSIDLNITGVPGLRWTGATSSDWDFGTPNWFSFQTGAADVFADAVPTQFLDGATTGQVNLTGDVKPSTIVVSNFTLPYVWSGTAGIEVPLLRKYGTNSLTRVETALDAIAGIELNAGAFAVSNIFNSTMATVFTDAAGGTGTFVKQGTSILTLSSASTTYDGAVRVEEGTLKLGANRSLGSVNGGTTITNGGTLDLNDVTPGFEPVVVSGAGAGGVGAIIDSTGTGTVDANLQDVVLAGDTTFGAPNGGRWDIRVRSGTGSGPGLRGNGYNLTKVGSGTVSIASQRSLGTNTPYWNLNLGDVVVEAGSLAFAESLTLGNPEKSLTINAGATVQLYDLGATNPFLRHIFINDARLTCGAAVTDTNIVNGDITLTGAGIFRPDIALLVVNGAVGGSGSLSIGATDAGTVYLNGTNTYPGDTVVSNHATLGGTGIIAGNLTMLAGSTNAPGMSLGTLTVNQNATLEGVTRLELNRSQTPNSDQLNVGGTLTFGGRLEVVLAAAPQAGDVYHLFNKAGGGTFTTISLPNISALPGSLTWDTSQLTVDGTLRVSGVATPPQIGSVSMAGGIFTLSGTGGIEGNSYVVLSSTNVVLPLANWTRVVTNVFGAGGSFTFTNAVSPADPAKFYKLLVP